ncbi:MAG: hypothetical protein HYZ18_11445 [Pseudogulbenkiania sp.]|nr:hypothetical protein [Pseudogulbenkiania sp.]
MTDAAWKGYVGLRLALDSVWNSGFGQGIGDSYIASVVFWLWGKLARNRPPFQYPDGVAEGWMVALGKKTMKANNNAPAGGALE